MDLLNLLILGLRAAALLFFVWYLVERCFTLHGARKLRARRRYEFQRACRFGAKYGDELDNIISK